MTDARELVVALSVASDIISRNWVRWGPERRDLAFVDQADLLREDLSGVLMERFPGWISRIGSGQEAISRVRRALDALESKGTESIPITDPRYPPQLRTLEWPPLVLHAIGRSLKSIPTGVAIVGSREPSPKSRSVTAVLASWLAKTRIPVITGMARGTDQTAARAALDAEGLLVGVVPGGTDQVIPKSCHAEYAGAYERGLILSETTGAFPVGKSSFLRRNRLISGLSRLVVVTSTKTDGGSINQLEWAHRQGRPSIVFQGGVEPGFVRKVPPSKIPYHFVGQAAMQERASALWADPHMSAQATLEGV